MFASHGVSHIQLAVRDRERSVRFYTQLLGLQELMRGKHSVMLRAPGARDVLTLNAHPEHVAGAGTMGGVAHFGFHLREPFDPAALAVEVERAGGKVTERGVRGEGPGAEPYLFATDPDGYEVEFFHQVT